MIDYGATPFQTAVVMFVDDEPALLEVGRRVLERHGYRVVTAPNGAVALSLLRSGVHAVDLLVTDMMMPKLSGPALLEVLQKDGIAPRTIFMSGHVLQEIEELPGVDPDIPLLEKPWTIESLVGIVREVLEAPRVTASRPA